MVVSDFRIKHIVTSAPGSSLDVSYTGGRVTDVIKCIADKCPGCDVSK